MAAANTAPTPADISYLRTLVSAGGCRRCYRSGRTERLVAAGLARYGGSCLYLTRAGRDVC